MSARLILVALIGLMEVSTALAHRLDEYLQATTIALEADHLTLQLRLIPGVAVATKVLAAIDTNGDGILADAEKQRYAAWVRHDLALSLNGKPVTLQLATSVFSPVGQISQGMRGILLTFEGDLPTGQQTYQLTVDNHHQPTITVYLMNCLLPDNPAIHIIDQTRNYKQSVYQLTFSVDRASLLRPSTPQSSQEAIVQPWTAMGSVIKTYFVLGIEHMLKGYDHLLFISALVLTAVSLWELVKIATVFTLAHSITLTLAALSLVHVPAQVVESLIAASIIVVAIQNIFWLKSAQGHSRLTVAFLFGLFHGLGFADGLLSIMQLTRGTALEAIVGFSAGVEAGHQLILLPLFFVLRAVRNFHRDPLPKERLSRKFQRFGSMGIMIGGLYYLWIALNSTI
jgi:hydrogenase/urease accessory protein HupE